MFSRNHFSDKSCENSLIWRKIHFGSLDLCVKECFCNLDSLYISLPGVFFLMASICLFHKNISNYHICVKCFRQLVCHTRWRFKVWTKSFWCQQSWNEANFKLKHKNVPNFKHQNQKSYKMQCNQPNCWHFEFMIIRLFTFEDDTQTIIVSVVDTVDASKCAIHAMERNCYQSKRRVLHVSIWFARLNKVHWLFSFPFYSAPLRWHNNHQWHNMSIDSKWREFDAQSVEAIE